MLDERKLKVLKAVINSYIVTAEPIGSRTISKDYNFGVSPATIRNEMSDLEDLGYLNKPHTSAGRIPSDKAYRLYVDHIMRNESRNMDKKTSDLSDTLRKDSRELEDIIERSSKLLSTITSYTTLAISPQVKRERLRNIQLISIDSRKILLVLVTETGVVKNTLFRSKTDISQDKLNVVSNLLNDNLDILNTRDFKENLDRKVEGKEIDIKLVEEVISIINKSLDSTEDIKVYTKGVDKIFNYPEYSNIEKARSFVSFIENRELLLDLLLDGSFASGIDISIGRENSVDPLKESSLLTATYKLGDKTIGKIGVIGPTRMDYFTVINALDIFSYTLTEMLSIDE